MTLSEKRAAGVEVSNAVVFAECEHTDARVLAIDEALEKLAEIDQQRAKIVELRFFGGLTNEEVAEAMGVSMRTIQKQWAGTRVWLRCELSEPEEE